MNRYGFIQRITITPDMKDPVSGQRVFFWIFSYWSSEQAVCQGWGYSYLKNVRWRFRLTIWILGFSLETPVHHGLRNNGMFMVNSLSGD